MRILIADKFDASGIDALKDQGHEVSFQPDLGADDLPAAIGDIDPDVLIVRSTKVGCESFEAATSLGLVIRAGAGYDTIDVATASSRGIFVANCPGRNSIAVAELAWGLILSCDRRIPDQTADLRDGRWNKKEYSKAAGLHGRTLAIIGLGQIGREVARRGLAFGMRIIGWSRSLTPKDAHAMGIEYAASAEDAVRDADVVSIHIAATDETRHLVDEQFLYSMKDGAFLINTSRGSVVNESALRNAIRTKGIRAGLDVFADEPASGDNAFKDGIVKERGVYGTHHVGASTAQAQQAIAEEAARIVESFAMTGAVPNCVNRAASTPATNLLTIRMQNQPGVLAHVFYILGQAKVNVEEMENIIYDGAKAACARIQLDETIGEDLLTAIRANQAVISVDVTTL